MSIDIPQETHLPLPVVIETIFKNGATIWRSSRGATNTETPTTTKCSGAATGIAKKANDARKQK